MNVGDTGAHWSWNDLLFALIPYVIAGLFAYVAFWDSERGTSRGWRIGAAVVLLVFAALLALVSINISSSQTSALARAKDEYRSLQGYLGTVGSLKTGIENVQQGIESLRSTKQDPSSQATIQHLSSQVSELSDTLQRIQNAARFGSQVSDLSDTSQQRQNADSTSNRLPAPVGQTPTTTNTSSPAKCELISVLISNGIPSVDFGNASVFSPIQKPLPIMCIGPSSAVAAVRLTFEGPFFGSGAAVVHGGLASHVSITFRPSSVGPFTGKLTLSSPDEIKVSPSVIALTGTGVQPTERR